MTNGYTGTTEGGGEGEGMEAITRLAFNKKQRMFFLIQITKNDEREMSRR